MLALSLLLAAAAIAGVSGHGGMVWPPVWQDGHYTPLNEVYNYSIYSDPKVIGPNTNRPVKDARSWLTDQAYIGGHGDNFKMTGLQTNFEGCRSFCSSMKTPWASPGKAPNLGGGCGIFGGNPYGCPAHDDVRPPGSECGDTARGFAGRGTWSYGASALEIDFPQAKNTEWERGSNQWVGWIAKGGHWGGYTYRLCKLPDGGKAGLTEECFAKNVLEFTDAKTWWKLEGEDHVNDAWQTVSKTDVVEGTYPEGSAWRPVVKVEGRGKYAKYLIRKDKVKVPENLPEGDYVLSFRWDAEWAAQVWVSCAFVKLV